MMAKTARTALKQLLFVLVALAALAAIKAFDHDAFGQSAEVFCMADECGLTSETGDVNFRRELAVKRAPPPKPSPLALFLARKPSKPRPPPIVVRSPPPVVASKPPPPPVVAASPPPPPVVAAPPPPPPIVVAPPPPPLVLASPPPPPVVVAPPPPPLVLASPPPPPVVVAPPPPPPAVPPPPPNPYPTSFECPVLGTAVYPPSKLARWDKNYMNNWTPVDPPGGLVISNDQLHVDMKITSKNQIFGAFLSQKRFIYGYYDIWIKLIPNNSAGIVMTYYFTSPENHTLKDANNKSLDTHDELDFEFLGNVSGQPITLQTNMHLNGQGNREVRHSLPFDPTADFHKYSLLWNQHIIIWYVDDSVIRVHHNKPDVPFPTWRPMAVHTSLWNGSSWATRGGLDKLDLAYQPFILQYEGFDGIDGCAVCQTGLEPNPDPNCPMAPNSSYIDACSSGNWWNEQQTLTAAQWDQVQCHEQHYVIYHYCYDKNRFKNWTTGVVTMPPECKYNELNYNYPP